MCHQSSEQSLSNVIQMNEKIILHNKFIGDHLETVTWLHLVDLTIKLQHAGLLCVEFEFEFELMYSQTCGLVHTAVDISTTNGDRDML